MADSEGRAKESGICGEPLWQVGRGETRKVAYTVGHFSIKNILPRSKVVHVLSHFVGKLR